MDSIYKTHEKINFENFIQSIQICQESMFLFKEYLEKTFETLVIRLDSADDKNITKSIFLNYLNLPLIVSKKIFILLDVDKDGYLSQSEFVEGMYDLYNGSFDKLLTTIFTLLTFSKHSMIYKEDVRLILIYLNSQENIINDIEIYLLEFFGSKECLNFEEFVNTIKNISSNIYILILLFLFKNQPFSEEGLKYFVLAMPNKIRSCIQSRKILMKTNNKLNQISKPSAEILKILKYYFKPFDYVKRKRSRRNVLVYEILLSDNRESEGVESCQEDINQNELDEFLFENVIDEENSNAEQENNNNDRNYEKNDHAKNKLFKFTKKPLIIYSSTFKQQYKKENLIKSSHKLISQEINSKFFHSTYHHSGILYSIEYSKEIEKKIICEKETIIQNNLINNDITTINLIKEIKINNESEISENSFNFLKSENILAPHFEMDIHKLSYEKKLIKMRMVIIGHELFLLKPSIILNDLTVDSLYSLQGIYATACVETELLGKPFYPMALLNSFGNTLAHLHNILFFKSKNDLNLCLQFVNKILNLREVSDDYEIKNTIGRGQFGKVKLGINKKTLEKVAIKIIEKKRLIGEELALVKTEIDVMKFLKSSPNQNVVKPFDFYEDKDFIYMIMEYLQGGTLNKFLIKKSQIMNEKFTQSICKQIANGISFLHKNGIIHRDIKPENIMILNSMNECNSNINFVPLIKITDFGLSKVMSNYEKTREGFGSLVYTSPEILLRKNYNSKVDIWSFGVLVYYVNTGLLPFDGVDLTLKEIAHKICYHNLSLNDTNFSKELKSLITECLTKNYRLRLDIKNVVNCKWFN